MAVYTHKFGHMQVYQPLSRIERDTKSALHEIGTYLTSHSKLDMVYYDMYLKAIDYFPERPSVKARRGIWYVGEPSIAMERSVENRLERLEKQFNNLVRSTWDYVFSQRDREKMKELSKGMLEGSKKLKELAKQLQETDD